MSMSLTRLVQTRSKVGSRNFRGADARHGSGRGSGDGSGSGLDTYLNLIY